VVVNEDPITRTDSDAQAWPPIVVRRASGSPASGRLLHIVETREQHVDAHDSSPCTSGRLLATSVTRHQRGAESIGYTLEGLSDPRGRRLMALWAELLSHPDRLFP
jgi:hypothetical protein